MVSGSGVVILDVIIIGLMLLSTVQPDLPLAQEIRFVKDSRATNLDALPVSLTMPEMARLLGVGHNKACELVHEGVIRRVRLGRAIRIPKREVVRMSGLADVDVSGRPVRSLVLLDLRALRRVEASRPAAPASHRALSRSASSRSASVRSALRRSGSPRYTKGSDARRRSAPPRWAVVRSARGKLASWRMAPRRSARTKFASTRSARRRLVARRSASRRSSLQRSAISTSTASFWSCVRHLPLPPTGKHRCRVGLTVGYNSPRAALELVRIEETEVDEGDAE